jgi:hypothetical protein
MNIKDTLVSFRRSPVAPLFDSLSLPARSIRFRTPWTCCSVFYKPDKCKSWDNWQKNRKYTIISNNSTSFMPLIRRVKTKWLRDDCSFICVLPTDLEICNMHCHLKTKARKNTITLYCILKWTHFRKWKYKNHKVNVTYFQPVSKTQIYYETTLQYQETWRLQ